ncbi:hypothetical protein ACFFGR_14480 [Arthrobacter liuii]|nr:hypothetical protein [Arthrobacter liuii]
MGSQEDAALVRRGYEAFITGDMETLREQFADDVVRHAAGPETSPGTRTARTPS